jgi:hypothetical protein
MQWLKATLKSWVKHSGEDPLSFEPFPVTRRTNDNRYVHHVGQGPFVTRFVVVSDTHEQHHTIDIPPEAEADVLIHCGDSTNWGQDVSAIQSFNEWLGTLPYNHKLVIGGNHETSLRGLSRDEIQAHFSNAIYLQDECCWVGSLKVYGVPYVPARNILYRANAFALPPDELSEAFARIPNDVDILVTHVPPLGVLDLGYDGTHHGSIALRRHVQRVVPLLHVFGHCHDDIGVCDWTSDKMESIVFANAAQIQSRMPLQFHVHSTIPFEGIVKKAILE